MKDRLVITSAILTNFGGTTTQKRVNFPSTGLVVLEGSNETGKSTVAEAVAWVLAEPSPDGETVARMGNRNDTMEARLEGTIDDLAFSLSGKFKIYANNKARRTDTSVVIGGQETTLDEFRQRIGLAEPTIYHHVFRVEGADGHTIGDADAVVAHAGSGVFGPIDPHEVADRFAASAKDRGKSRSRSVDSVRNREAVISSLHSQLDEAGRNASEYREEVDTVDEAKGRESKIRLELRHLRQTQNAFGTAKSVTTDLAKVRTLRSSLEKATVVPAEWATVVGSLSDLALAHGGLASRQSGLERAINDGLKAAQRNERSIEELSLLVIDEVITTQLMSAAQRAEQAAATEWDLQAQVAGAVDEMNRAHISANSALAKLGPMAEQPGFDPTLARIDDTGLSLAQPAEAVRNAVAHSEQAQENAVSARDAVVAAQARLGSAEELYRSFNTGMKAEDLVSGAGISPPLSTPDANGPSVAGWFAPVALAVVAVVAAVSGQYPLAAVAVLGAVVSAVLQKRRSDIPAPMPAEPTVGRFDAARDAAMDVLDARRAIPGLEESASKDEGNARRAADSVVGQREKLARALGDAGLPTDIAPEHVASVAAAWRRAAGAVTYWRSASTDLKGLEGRLAAAKSETIEATRQLTDSLEHFKIEPGGVAAVAASLSELSRDASAARTGVNAQVELKDLKHRVTELLAPVGLGVDDAPDATQRAKSFEEAMREQAELERRIAELEQSIATALEASETVAELVASDPDTTRLEALELEVGEKIEEIDQQLQQAIENATSAQSAADSLLDVQRITELQEQISEHDAAANDLAIDALAAAIAHLLVEEEAVREEQNRRPVLVERTSEIATSVAREWSAVRAIRPPAGERGVRLVVDMNDGAEVPAHQLSTGARMLLYLSLRLAVADGLGATSQVALPLLCDDPLVNVDGQRAPEVMKVLAESAKKRQIIVMTCHPSTSELARQFGGVVEYLDSTLK